MSKIYKIHYLLKDRKTGLWISYLANFVLLQFIVEKSDYIFLS